MIRVRRPTKGPAVLGGAKSAAARERKAAVKHFRPARNRNRAFQFRVYSDPLVKDALERLFSGKCAYCESSYRAHHPVDVEHFRPKGGVIIGGRVDKPGYYWLAATWTNLYPSCIDCNRQRYHRVGTNRMALGKGGRFPIADERRRARKPGAERWEKPLLLDPTRDNPAKHLLFDATGLVQPRSDRRGVQSEKGRVSIEVYGLARPALAERRKSHATLVLAQCARVKELLADLEEHGVPRKRREDLRKRLIREVRVLRGYCGRKGEFLALSRALVKRELGRGLPRMS